MKVVEKIKTHILCSVTFSENRAVYEKMSKNVVEPERRQTIRRMRVAYWISEQEHARSQTPTHACTHTDARTHKPHLRAGARKHGLADTNMQYLLFHGNNSFVNATQQYVKRTLSVLLPHNLTNVTVYKTK